MMTMLLTSGKLELYKIQCYFLLFYSSCLMPIFDSLNMGSDQKLEDLILRLW